MNVPSLMRERLAVLAPTLIEIQDDSAAHAGHAGARDGGHYRLRIVAATFAGKSKVMRHRLVYDALVDLMRNGIHALSIQAETPNEM